MGFNQDSLPFFFDNAKDRAKGIWHSQAGLEHLTVRAQNHAITNASPPPFSDGSFTLGYKCPIRFSASSRIHWEHPDFENRRPAGKIKRIDQGKK
jgi:hypothetical protein